ncbi:SapB/AmfS family lanthipeptide [Streptomyces gobiensis]|nr:SapB/AmfS family lanthipeptide [Streptomyces gobiensis]UGY91134.1 SapB/AmfS family lanthipeptide [Streptomyces gobiensis]
MALLDLQTLETPEMSGGGNPSAASLLLCGDSSVSLTTC